MGHLSMLYGFNEFNYFLPDVTDERLFIRLPLPDFVQILPADFFAI